LYAQNFSQNKKKKKSVQFTTRAYAHEFVLNLVISEFGVF